jgi:hypothetical protein
MKKILLLALIAVFVTIPFGSFAQTAISDRDMSAIFAQEGSIIAISRSGSITITLNDFTVKSQSWGVISSTDGLDFWSPGRPGYHPKYTGDSYIGYADFNVTGGLVKSSGTMIIDVTYNPAVLSNCQVIATLNSVHIDAGALGYDFKIKLGTDPTLAGNQTLGHVYMSGPVYTMSGTATVYAYSGSPPH